MKNEKRMGFEEFKRLHEDKGMHWFSAATMRFFKSRVCDWHPSGFFISSEQGPVEGSRRKFTLRFADFETGSVRAASEFQEFETLHRARRALECRTKE